MKRESIALLYCDPNYTKRHLEARCLFVVCAAKRPAPLCSTNNSQSCSGRATKTHTLAAGKWAVWSPRG